MEIQVKRPVIWLTIAYAIGIIMRINGIATNKSAIIFWVVAAFLVCLAWVIEFNKGTDFILVLAILVLVGAISVQLWLGIENPLNYAIDQMVWAQGQIIDTPKYMEEKDVYIIETTQITLRESVRDVKAKVQVTVYPDGKKDERVSYDYGDIVQINGVLQLPQEQRNPKGFDYRAYLKRRGIYSIMTIRPFNIKKIGTGKISILQSCLQIFKHRAEVVFEKGIRGKEGDLLRTMILGEKWLLPPEIRLDFQNTGLSHILAISGLHVGFIVTMLIGLMQILPFSKKCSFMLQVAVLCLYCLLVGAAPSVMRATVMAVMLLGGKVVGRQPDPLNNLFIAALIILLFRPLDLFEVGFQLSFGAVLGIIFFSKYFREWLWFLPRWMASGLSITLSAQLGVWPLIAYYFNTFSIVAVLANLIFVPLAGVIVNLGFGLMLGAQIIPPLIKIFGPLLKLLCSLLIKGNEVLAAMPWTFISVVSPSLLFIICYFAVLWLLSEERPRWLKKPLLWCSGLAVILLLFTILGPMLQKDLYMVFLDVGQGDCIYIRTPDKKHILIDGGGKSLDYTGSFHVGDDIVVPFLLKNGIGHLDLVVMSHCHDDHIGGLVSVLRDIPVKTFMEYTPGEETDNYKQLKALVTAKGIRNIYANADATYRVGRDVWLDVIYPCANEQQLHSFFHKGDNNRSLVLLLRYDDTTILFTGDIEAEVEEHLYPGWEIPVDILKVAHHGSHTSSTDNWLEALQPQLAVIQVGKNNFGHPHPDVLERLEQKGIDVLRNDISGAVMCSFQKDKWSIRWMVNEL